ncbi:hypothetical protein GCM10022233_65730 [Streptomyces shaanxiensis]|uniref:Uncharacterized protein n=1 Tax=Streptomyces shaanxiensis TaxID=653357 RepID=A0ABP7VZ23_9ACTN
MAAGVAVPSGVAAGQIGPGAPTGGDTEPFMAMVGLSSGRTGTADRSYPHAPQKRSPDSSGHSQLGQADNWGICDINYTHVRGR